MSATALASCVLVKGEGHASAYQDADVLVLEVEQHAHNDGNHDDDHGRRNEREERAILDQQLLGLL